MRRLKTNTDAEYYKEKWIEADRKYEALKHVLLALSRVIKSLEEED